MYAKFMKQCQELSIQEVMALNIFHVGNMSAIISSKFPILHP